MGFQLTLTIDVDDNPDAIGEALRSRFFDEKLLSGRIYGSNYRETGCYSTFDWHPEVEPLPDLTTYPEEVPEAYREEEKIVWTRGLLPKTAVMEAIECRYYWDGDGTLAFILPDGSCLVNDDCKKDHGWEVFQSKADCFG